MSTPEVGDNIKQDKNLHHFIVSMVIFCFIFLLEDSHHRFCCYTCIQKSYSKYETNNINTDLSSSLM